MKTTHLKLPYLAADQAQKHVTVNESLRRLDALTHMQVLRFYQNTPPATPEAGDQYVIGATPTGLWQNQAGRIATYVDGAWQFSTPQNGWRIWDQQDKILRLYDSGKWLNLAPQFSPQMGFVTTSLDHIITPGSYNDTALNIADRDLVLGIGMRVVTALPNNQSWKLGVAADAGRYGAHISGAAQTTNIGMTSHPMTYYATTPLRISGQNKALTSGTIRLQLHVLRLSPPAS
ncbi:MAG: DUF2793 domain-containing protein [Parvibaculales bacterium]